MEIGLTEGRSHGRGAAGRLLGYLMADARAAAVNGVAMREVPRGKLQDVKGSCLEGVLHAALGTHAREISFAPLCRRGRRKLSICGGILRR